jgi:class 3 adenylate cyclase
VPLGHRKRLLKAIASFGATALGPALAPSPSAQATAPPMPETAGQRRHVTVMFCDLVDSTGITARLDAEEWRDLVGAYVEAASASVTEMGGRVAKKLGDGLMALFGYPVGTMPSAPSARRSRSRGRPPRRRRSSRGPPALCAPRYCGRASAFSA